MNNQLIEEISDAVHQGWMETKQGLGVTTRRSETDEELMVPYSQLSESAKDLDRGTVRSVLSGLERAGYDIVKRP